MSKPRQNPGYSFPILKHKELSPCLGELGIHVSSDEIKAATSPLVRGVYESFLTLFTSITPSSFQQMDFAALSHFEHPQMHEEAIQAVGYNRVMVALFEAAGVHDFSLHDILHPEAKRTRVLLSALVNFAKYRESKLELFNQLTSNNEEIMQRAEGVMVTFEDIAKKLDALKAEIAAEEPECEQTKAVIQQKQALVTQYNEKQCELQTLSRALKNETTELADQVAKKQFGVKNIEAECSKLQTQIVQSPERVKREMANMAASVESEKENVIIATKKGRELKKKLQVLTDANESVVKTVKSIELFANEVKRNEQVLKKRQSIQEQSEAQHEAMRGLVAQEGQLKRQISLGQEKLIRAQKQHALRKAQTEKEYQTLQEEVAAMQSKQSKSQEQQAETDIQCQELIQEIADIKAAQAAETHRLTTEYNNLNAEMDQFHERLFKACAKVA